MKTTKLAAYIVHKAAENGHHTTNLKLNKLMYILQVVYLKAYSRPLVLEQFEIWPWGPCLPSVYYKYCGYGAMPIRTHPHESIPWVNEDLTPEQIECLDLYISRYADCCPWDYEPEWFGDESVFAEAKNATADACSSGHSQQRPIIANSLLAELVRSHI